MPTTTWLPKNRTPEDLIRFWLGHADETVTDGYSKLREGVEYHPNILDAYGGLVCLDGGISWRSNPLVFNGPSEIGLYNQRPRRASHS